MLKCAEIWLLMALGAALLAFGGLLQDPAGILEILFVAFSGLCVLSLSFSLFEEEDEPETSSTELQH